MVCKAKTYLKDYQAPTHSITEIFLDFDLGKESVRVESILKIEPSSSDNKLLELQGEELCLKEVCLNGLKVSPSKYKLSKEGLSLSVPSKPFVLKIVTEVFPKKNTRLEGLYQSGKILCSQMEAEGFRRMTYFLDRPDVLSIYTVKITADKEQYPYLLSNGNLVEHKNLSKNRHYTLWKDPFPKPCYLFALVAGNLVCVEDHFITCEGKDVLLQMYVEEKEKNKCQHALASLKKAMAWDEEVYGLVYDLDRYMIVAVDDFNAGAMENKGLNIFNTSYALAHPKTATDKDFENVESVIAHEYFHNWTGNRVTLRDWFQLCLKEGLTVFRDQEFSGDMQSRAVKRIEDVMLIKNHQFSEDKGPMSHSVRPDSFVEIDNFYTLTVYNKGAELIRMLYTLLGKEAFYKGVQHYLKTYDGLAATIEDFLNSMTVVNKKDLSQFKHWYNQSGTPQVKVSSRYFSKDKQLKLYLEQKKHKNNQKAFHFPFKVALFDTQGLPMDVIYQHGRSKEPLLEVKNDKEIYLFEDVYDKPILSLLRSFTAPVKLDVRRKDQELLFLMEKENDLFNAWDACVSLTEKKLDMLIRSYQQGHRFRVSKAFLSAFSSRLNDYNQDPALIARLFSLPEESEIANRMEEIAVEAIFYARKHLVQAIARKCRIPMLELYKSLHKKDKAYHFDAASVGLRTLKNTCLQYLVAIDDPIGLTYAFQQLQDANNMTDEITAFRLLVNRPSENRELLIQDFYEKWKDETLVINKWFAIQAAYKTKDTLICVQNLIQHPDFSWKTPNRVYALLRSFIRNSIAFHDREGKGYELVSDCILRLDSLNAQVAARLVTCFSHWKRYDTLRKRHAYRQLKRFLKISNLSPNVVEIVQNTLN